MFSTLPSTTYIVFRFGIDCIPVTAPRGGPGGAAWLVPKSTIDRQPVEMFTQVAAPMYILLLFDIAMVVWVPSPIATELAVVRVMALTSTTSNVPVDPPGYPARYRLVPFISPTLAPPTATVDLMVWD